jgi:hypothetical protein
MWSHSRHQLPPKSHERLEPMSFLSGIDDLLKQYSGGANPAGVIYALHPVLLKSLGAAALTIAMKKIADQHAG